MSKLKLSTWRSTAVVEVLDADLTPVETVALSPAEPWMELELSPGRYQVRARRPDGQTARVRAELPDEGLSIDLDELFWPRREMSPLEIAARLGRADAFLKRFFPPRAFLHVVRGKGARPAPAEPPGTLKPATSSADERFVSERTLPLGAARSSAYWNVDWNVDVSDRLFLALALESELPEHPMGSTWFVSLPVLEFSTLIVVDTVKAATEEGGFFRLLFRTESPRLDMLLELLGAPAPDRPGVFFEQLVGREESFDEDADPEGFLARVAHDMMKSKFESPHQAAAAGHYLLRFNMLDRVRDWPRNLADYFPWLPDGAIVEGWRRLLAPEGTGNPSFPRWRRDRPPPATARNPRPNDPRPEDPVEDAALRFVDATFRGPPVFAAGLRRLYDGIRWCRRRIGEESELAEELREAEERTRPWLAASAPAGAFAGYRGVTDPTVLFGEDSEVTELERVGEPVKVSPSG